MRATTSDLQPPPLVPPPLVVVMGVAGAGKSTVGAALARSLGVDFVDADDIHSRDAIASMRSGRPLDDTERGPWLERCNAELRRRREGGAVMACSALRASHRDALRAGLPALRFVVLAVPEPVVRRRLDHRAGHFFGSALLPSQLDALELTANTIVIDGDLPVPAVVAAALDAITVDDAGVEPAGAHRPALAAHRLLGHGRCAALVHHDGRITWWTPARVDATPLLWSLLDRDGGGASWLDVAPAWWDGRPAGPTARTDVRQGGQRIELWDGLVAIGSGHVLVRLARATGESVRLTHRLRAGGFDAPWVRWRDEQPSDADGGRRVVGDGEHRIDGADLWTTLEVTAESWSGLALAVDVEPDADLSIPSLLARMTESETALAHDLARVRLPRDHPSRAVDALLVMRALTDLDSGAPAASATTSVPEAPGGTRQFDYRYTWLRDSAHAVATAALLGSLDAATKYLGFIAEQLARIEPDDDLPPLTTTAGEPVPDEREIDGVAGWAGSRPMRVGNGAASQRQIDSYAAVIEAIAVHLGCGGSLDATTWATVDSLAERLVRWPGGPTSGVWEIREPAPLVSEELARWVGLDRALRIQRRHRPWRRRPAWVAARRAARAKVEAALDERLGIFPQEFDAAAVVPDAACLLAATNTFYRRRDPRLDRLVRACVTALEEDVFLRRYPPLIDDGFVGTEAAFIPAGWWAVTALAVIGDLDEARRRADGMCAQLPPLVPEQWDAVRGEGLGNTPLLWSHTECARALYRLDAEAFRARYGTLGLAIRQTLRYLRVRRSMPRRTS